VERGSFGAGAQSPGMVVLSAQLLRATWFRPELRTQHYHSWTFFTALERTLCSTTKPHDAASKSSK